VEEEGWRGHGTKTGRNAVEEEGEEEEEEEEGEDEEEEEVHTCKRECRPLLLVIFLSHSYSAAYYSSEAKY
jgi:hypothetical protein